MDAATVPVEALSSHLRQSSSGTIAVQERDPALPAQYRVAKPAMALRFAPAAPRVSDPVALWPSTPPGAVTTARTRG